MLKLSNFGLYMCFFIALNMIQLLLEFEKFNSWLRLVCEIAKARLGLPHKKVG